MFYKKLFTLCLAALILVTSVFFVGCSSSDRDKYQKEEGEGSGILTGYDAARNLVNMDISLWVQYIDGEDIGQWELDITHANTVLRFERGLKNAGIDVELGGKIKLYMTGTTDDMMIFVTEFANLETAKLIYENADAVFTSSGFLVAAKRKDNVVVSVLYKEGKSVTNILNSATASPEREDDALTLESVISNIFRENYQLTSPCIGSVISKDKIKAGCQSVENNVISYFSSKGLDASPINGKLDFYCKLRNESAPSSESISVFRFKDAESALWAGENAKYVIEGINAHTSKGVAAKVDGDVVIICEALTDSRAGSLVELAMGTY